MNRAPRLVGTRIILRRPLKRDIDDRLRLGRHPEIVRIFGGDTRNLQPITNQEAIAWYQGMLARPLEWTIEFYKRWIGNVRLTLDEPNYRARFAIGIFDPSLLGMGLGSEAIRLILNYAFNELHLHRIDLRVLQYNKRAVYCFEKCGFRREGIEREGALIENRWETDVIMSILEQEYRRLLNTDSERNQLQ